MSCLYIFLSIHKVKKHSLKFTGQGSRFEMSQKYWVWQYRHFAYILVMVVSLLRFHLLRCFFVTVSLALGMATKPVSMDTRPYQPRFDGFSPIWLGLGFPRFHNTGTGRVTGIYVPTKNPYPNPTQCRKVIFLFLLRGLIMMCHVIWFDNYHDIRTFIDG